MVRIMNNKSQYKTKQRADLIDFMMSKMGEHVTVNDVCSHFEEKGKTIGVTTVYRQLDKMVAEGIVNKYTLESGNSACYEYVGDGHGSEEVHKCYHCKCDKCGKLIHLHCGEIEEMMNHIRAKYGFVINPRRTVFYGLCEDCQND